ncbi:MAG TPA: hypothetical protein VJZ71_08010 [Phycisphaerae bacterium]|nr:hypothetical protein [Phycisphaerae bacterium]
MHKTGFFVLALVGSGLGLSSGCAVPQPRGEGLYSHVQEPTTKAWYHLYLPVDYVKNNGRHPDPRMERWPLVMTFHGMKPYDNARPQEREWEKQADIYGYIVCAPELETCDSFMEYPLTREHGYVLEDKKSVIAIMDHVFATTLADPRRVLATSWSCGGYFAHYFPNRFPDRFSCIATRLSNFSAKLLAEETVPFYRNRMPVAIFIGDGDFPACKSESEEAVAWYTARGFRTVRGKMIDAMGHRRIPQTAAAFFAEQEGIEPLRPLEAAQTVAQVQMTEYYPAQEMIARFSPPISPEVMGTAMVRTDRTSRRNSPPLTPAVVPPTRGETVARSPTSPPARTTAYANSSAGKRYPFDRRPAYDPLPGGEGLPESASVPPSQQKAPSNQRGNWLSQTQAPPAVKEAAPGSRPPSKTPSPRNPADRGLASSSRPPSEGSKSTGQPAASDEKANPRPGMASPSPTLASNTPRKSFSPSSAGGRSYVSPVAAKSPASAAKSIGRPPAANDPTLDGGSPARAQAPRARRVNVRLGGPAIGTSPHYLAYSADLPADLTNGADFLWMDNGVWIGDEQRGVKILESPGLHRISVLIVTPDNIEYRGSATVQVLDRGPTASAN